MSTQAPNSGLSYDWVMGQSGWGLQMDQNMRALDALLSIDVISSSLNTPPETPIDGDRYIIGPEPTGVWSGHAGKIARFINNSWEVYKNYLGRRAYVQDAGSLYRWDGSAWSAISGGSSGGLPTNLSATRTANDVVINSSTGTGVNIGAASTTVAGLMTAADKSKLDSIDGGGGGSSPTNITISADASTVTVESSTGSDGIIGAATNSTAGVMSSSDKGKLDGIESGATQNSPDSELKDRANHTGTQTASTISDLASTVQGIIGTSLVAGSFINISYNPVTGETTISSSGGGGEGSPTDISITQTATSVTVASSTGNDGVINQASSLDAGVMSASDKQKLDGVENGATANSTDTHLLSRDNHTGTQLASTISDFTEAAQDAAGSMMIAGSGISIAYDDNANTLTVSATGGGGGGGGASTWVATDTTLTKNRNCFTTNQSWLHLPPDMIVGDFVFFKNATPWEVVVNNNYYTINGEFGSISSGTGLTLKIRESLYVVCVSEGVLEII